MNEMVSIVIPAYQAENHIERCLRSICNQSYPFLEIIVIDDGSEDGTVDICKIYAEKDSRVHIYTQDNAGPSAARNHGIRKANGIYLYFMDSDDFIESDTIAHMVNYMKNGSDMIAVSFANLDWNGQRVSGLDAKNREYTIDSVHSKAKFLVECFLKYRIGFEVWNKIYRLDTVKSNECHFIEGIHYAEDVFFNLSYLLYANRISTSSKVCYKREVHSGSLSSIEKFKLHLNETVAMAIEIKTMYEQVDTEWNQYFYYIYNEMMNDSYLRVQRFLDLKKYIRGCSVKHNMRQFQKWAIIHPIKLTRFYGIKLGIKSWIKAIIIYRWCK